MASTGGDEELLAHRDLVPGAGHIAAARVDPRRRFRTRDLLYGGSEVRVGTVPFDDLVLVTRPLGGRFAVRSEANLVYTQLKSVVLAEELPPPLFG